MAETNPNFILTSDGVAPFFSYVSTFPLVKCKVCYLGDNRITEDWIKMTHKLVTDPDKMKNTPNLYVIGNREVLESKAKKLIASLKSSPKRLLLL